MSASHANSDGARSARRWLIRGKVQGVGFRPTVARVATQLRLQGTVANAVEGVLIELEGDGFALAAFIDHLRLALPSQAEITAIETEPLLSSGHRGFAMIASNVGDRGSLRTRVPADVRVCSACLAEVRGVAARRAGYAFVSCVDCGPRYSIVSTMPFDRERTAMSRFYPCVDCAREYGNPDDRRFHAQTNACHRCGPEVQLLELAAATRSPSTQIEHWLDVAARALRSGAIVALRGLGGFQLLVDATNDAAVQRLRKRKARAEKPLAVLVRDLVAARELAEIGPLQEQLLIGPVGPIVLARGRQDLKLSPYVNPGLHEVGVMLPTTPLHALLADRCGPLIATSANRDGEPLIYGNALLHGELRANIAEMSDLGELADIVLTHNRDIERPVDDSVTRVVAGRPVVLRVGRGYAPLPLPFVSGRAALPVRRDPVTRGDRMGIVALGGHQKAAFAYYNGDQAVLGPHVGDLDGEPCRQRYIEQLRGFLALFGGEVAIVAHDAHPDYYTTRVAETWQEHKDLNPDTNGQMSVRLVSVQHHHAHVVAAMAEHRLLSREVLGVAWDGTGWGPDGTIWGGEFLVATTQGYRRVARFRPFALPGGDRAAREPWRTALSLLAQAWDDPVAAAAWLERRAIAQWGTDAQARGPETVGRPPGGFPGLSGLETMARWACADPNARLAPWTSSVGRLFDGVAALAMPALLGSVSFEGQAATIWESTASEAVAAEYNSDGGYNGNGDGKGDGRGQSDDAGDYALTCCRTADASSPSELDWRPLVCAVVRDVELGRPVELIALLFHAALAEAIARVADRHADLPVVLGGGVFQNRLLVEMTAARFAARGRWLGTPGLIPVNDGGLAAGQLAVAMATSTGMEPTMEMERAMDVAERIGNDVAMDEAT